jgi:phospholipid/cholesterol/gamma-HCH transport system permease protein
MTTDQYRTPSLFSASLTWLGGSVRQALGEMVWAIGFGFALLRQSAVLLIRRQIASPVLVSQIYFTGVEALPILAVISLSIGAAVVLQGVSMFPQFGQGELTYKILILVITRELGPLLTALILAARSGSAITTELGNMVVDHEIEAYVAAGISPIQHIAVPRVIGVTLAMVFLNLYFSLFGLFGSCFLASLIHGLPLGEYLGHLVLVMTAGDILSSLLKSVVFGIILATVATYYGFKVEGAVTEVPQKTIASLGVSMTLCILASTVITVLMGMV